MTGESDNQESNVFDWHDALLAVDKALLLDRDSFDAWVQDKDNQLLISQAGMTIQELRKKYWQVRLFKLIGLFRGEIEGKQNKSARQFVGEIITKADLPAPNWYVKALIEADKSPHQSRKGKIATEKLKLKLKSAVYFALIKHYRNERFPVRKGTSGQLVPEIFQDADSVKIEETAAKGYRKEIVDIVGSDYFTDQSVVAMFIGLLKIDIEKVAQVLNIQKEDY